MAEIKRNFAKGKMNMDFSPFVLPVGEYRDLLNGRVARSEGSDVGALENVRGNIAKTRFVDPAAVSIGAIRDQQQNKIYYFVVGQTEDGIYEYDEVANAFGPVVRSTSQSGVLKFSVDNLITGINLIGEDDDRLLYWTDGANPPRRINIARMIERHEGRLDGVIIRYADEAGDVSYVDDNGNTVYYVEGDAINNVLVTEVRTAGFTEEEISVVKAAPLEPPSISTIAEANPVDAVSSSEEEQRQEENLKEKFVRFAYRWKYIDDEISAYSPFSDIPFSVGRFSYDRVTGQITSMENLVRAVGISFNTGPRDVTDVDLLYIDSNLGVVFVVESFNKENEGWRDNENLRESVPADGPDFTETPIEFSTNKLYRPLPDSELFRVFDDVPTRARAQDIIENRLVYGDYTTRYNIEDIRKVYLTDANDEVQLSEVVREDIVIDFNARLADNQEKDIIAVTNVDTIKENGEKNLKSDRDYELAIVYGDNVGRRTPPLTSRDNIVHVPLNRANKRNSIEVDIKSKAPEWATWYRWYIKNNRETHYSIIPLDIITQPDDNTFKWFRIAAPDQNKVKEGDHLLLKLANNEFLYNGLTTQNPRQTFRIEEIGFRERNFLELEEPRVGQLANDTTGEIIDPGVVLTLQKQGIWAKVRNMTLLGRDASTVQDTSVSLARANTARDLDNRPIVDISSENWQDLTYYYEGPVVQNSDVSELSVTFGGTHTPGTGLNSGVPTGWSDPEVGPSGYSFGPTLSDADSYPGPMRVEITVEANNTYSAAYYLSPTYDEPQVVKGTVNLLPTALPVAGTTVPLWNGVNIKFNLEPGNYNQGDRFVCTWRLAENFMWRCTQKGDRSEYRGPNSTYDNVFNARRAHVMFGMGQLEDGINGGSLIQIGIEQENTKGLGKDDPNANFISLPFDQNQFYTDDVFYDNIEEWIFQEGLWSAGASGKYKFKGGDREGNDFGIHQMGFWRGLPTVPGGAASLDDVLRFLGVGALAGAALLPVGAVIAVTANLALAAGATVATIGTIVSVVTGPIGWTVLGVIALISIFAKKKDVSRDFRLVSGPPNRLKGGLYLDSQGDHTNVLAPPVEGANAMPLYGFIQQGKYNKGGKLGNRNKADHRLKCTMGFVQGTGAMEDDLSTLSMLFETIPGESVLDDQIFYETLGETLVCQNGIHYGPGKKTNQLITYLTANGTEITEIPIADRMTPLTETSKVTPISVPVDYWNCIAFSNGVETMTIRDEYGTPIITKGIKASNVVEDYKELRNFAGLIYSGPYVDTTGINRLNEFSSNDVGNRTILKEMDENYGPIRKLYAENTDLHVFQESKVNRVQVDKNALFNADGSTNIASSNNFLNQTIPVIGEYGISNNPESFSVYGHTKFWADKNRGVVLQLEGQQITEISERGMRDYFRDNLAESTVVIGSYDDYHDQYIITMRDRFENPSDTTFNIPLILSKQGFLSRNEACRFPENKLQYQQVYEFYNDPTPNMYQIGDTLFTDRERTSVFSGDDDWFIAFEPREAALNNVGLIGDDEDTSVRFTYVDPEKTLENALENGQKVFIESVATLKTYSGIITASGEDTIVVQFDGIVDEEDRLSGAIWNIEVDFKYVINVDNFGVVRRKIDCVGVVPYNHDAFRASLNRFSSAEEACANGLVGQILYHSGNSSAPAIGDYIYDSPYGSDEYVETYQNWIDDFPYNKYAKVVFNNSVWQASQNVLVGIIPGDTEGGADAYWTATEDPIQYKQGRTTKRGWFQIFDGADNELEDYVIHVLQGTVVDKERCAAIDANRTTISIGSHFVRAVGESDAEFATRVCRSVPDDDAYHNGPNSLPRIGDTLFQDNYTDLTYGAGSYPIAGGYYVTVNTSGLIYQVEQCVINVCFSDLLTTYGFDPTTGTRLAGLWNEQINTSGKFIFEGIINESIYLNRNRQDAANVTIRWAAKGSSRYPSTETDFFETSFPTGIIVGQEVTLTTPQFELDRVGESRLEYTIVEFCYDQTLVPSDIAVRYYNDGGEEYDAVIQHWTNATTTQDAEMQLKTSEIAIAMWNFFTGEELTTLPATDQSSVAREDFYVYFDPTVLSITSGSTLTLDVSNDTVVFVGTGGIGTNFAFPSVPAPDDILPFKSGGIPTCVADGITYQYPSGEAANVVARIFDITGNACTGVVEVSDSLFFDRTAVTRRQYFVDDLLTTPLDGTDGITNESFLDSRIVDGVQTFGLWWAFGDQDNSAATEALLIDKDGYVLDNRQRAFPFDIQLKYHPDSELEVCTNQDIPLNDYLSNNDNFGDATSFRNIDGQSFPPRGWYTWFDNQGTYQPEDNQDIVRFWEGEAFSSTIPIDNCPVTLPSTMVFFSEDDQKTLCGEGSLTEIWVDNGTIGTGDMQLIPDTDIQLYDNPYGRIGGSLIPGGYIQLLNRSTQFLLWNPVLNTLEITSMACTTFCTEEGALNIDAPGSCYFPEYCNDNRYNEYLVAEDSEGVRTKYTPETIPDKFGPQSSLCLSFLPEYAPRTVEVTVTDNIKVAGVAGAVKDINFVRTDDDDIETTITRGADNNYVQASGADYPENTGISGDSFSYLPRPIELDAKTGWRSDPGDPLTSTESSDPQAFVFDTNPDDFIANITIDNTGNVITNTPVNVELSLTDNITGSGYTLFVSGGSLIGDDTKDRVLPGNNWDLNAAVNFDDTGSDTSYYYFSSGPTVTFGAESGSHDEEVFAPWNGGSDGDNGVIALRGYVDEDRTSTVTVAATVTGTVSVGSRAPAPSVGITGSSTGTAGSGSVQLTATPYNFTNAPTSYSWNSGGAERATGATPSFSEPLGTGMVRYYVTASNSSESASNSFVIDWTFVCTPTGASVSITGNDGAVGIGQDIALSATSIVPGENSTCTGNFTLSTYNWNTGSASVKSGCGTSNDYCTLNNASALSQSVTLSITNSNGDTSGNASTTAVWQTLPGCTNTSAANYDANATSGGTCYYTYREHYSGASETAACNIVQNGLPDLPRQTYTTTNNPTFANGLQLYRLTTDGYIKGGNGWFTNDGVASWQQTNGLVSNYDADGCPAPGVTITNFDFTTEGQPPFKLLSGEDFTITVAWTVTNAPAGQQYDVSYSGNGITTVTDTVSILDDTPTLTYTGTHKKTFVTATVALAGEKSTHSKDSDDIIITTSPSGGGGGAIQ